MTETQLRYLNRFHLRISYFNWILHYFSISWAISDIRMGHIDRTVIHYSQVEWKEVSISGVGKES